MAGFSINVSVEELRRFREYIGNFSKYIDGDCRELEAAASRLAGNMSEEEVAMIRDTVKQITQIVDQSHPQLEQLQSKVENYAGFVERLKQISGQ